VLGEWFLSWGGHMTLEYGEERIYNPLPFYHLFMGLHTPVWVMMHAGCMIIADRFSPARFWKELGDSGATIAAFLGLMPPLLLAQDPTPEEKRHRCRRSICAGIPPAMREAFESRFAIPVLDGWGMTEVARNIGNYDEPRDLAKGAIGRTRAPMEARIVDDDDRDLPDGEVGELILRSSGPDPRDGFTSGYLKDPEATERAWRGGWFHTGDFMKRGPDGMLYFVDRKKNIIRRSGENIAAAEVELTIMGHPGVRLCVCIAAADDLRQEEVMALVVPRDGVAPTQELADAIVEHALANLSYYKAPGWLRFMKDLPMSGSQKIQKFRLFPGNEDPRDGAIDFREKKARRKGR
jgi:crotonobetaine/carnitine-CoA ligase